MKPLYSSPIKLLWLLILLLQYNIHAKGQWTNVGITKWTTALHVDGKNVIAAAGGSIYRSSNYGNHWDSLGSPQLPVIYSIEAMEDTILVGGYWSCADCWDTASAVCRTVDSGKTWKTVKSAHYGVGSICKNSRYLYTNPDARLYRSDDRGATWYHVISDSIFTGGVSKLYVYNDILYAVTANQMFCTLDDGESWIPMAVAWGSSFIYEFVRKDSLFFTGTSDGIYRSTDYGNSWSKFSPGNHIISALLAVGDSLYASWDYLLYITGFDIPVWRDVTGGVGAYWALESSGNYLFAGTGTGLWRRHLSERRSVDLKIRRGWNLLSLPLAVPDASKGALFPDASSSTFSYNGALYHPEDTLLQGEGYWLRYDKDTILIISGVTADEDTINILAGWNMIGSISSPVPFNAVLSEPPGILVSWLYKHTGNRYMRGDTIMPGSGYWVKADKSGQLILSSAFSANPSNLIRFMPGDRLPPPPPDEEYSISNQNHPKEFLLEQSYPNPFNPTTRIQYQLPMRSRVTLKIFDVLGCEVTTLTNGVEEAGDRFVEWVAENNPSGIYFYRLEAVSVSDPTRSFIQIKKTVLIR